MVHPRRIGGGRIRASIPGNQGGRYQDPAKVPEGVPVAIKFLDILPWADSPFKMERELVQKFDHPGIPRYFDVGRDDASGVPYLVMEYVQGWHITRYCREERLGVEGCLDLFVQLCRVVEYIHLTMPHGDLKPANVLVTTGGRPDAPAQIKVLDFGTGYTPSHMSPEQGLGGMEFGENVGKRSDVYSLGVILYELLSGRLPIAGLDRESFPSKIRQVVQPASGVAPEERRRALRGNLDAIVLKALEKEATQRYGLVSELREDLERYQKGFSVSARECPTWESIWRLSLKNKAAAVLLAASAVCLTGGMHLSGMRMIDYQAKVRDEANEARRMVFLLTEGLPMIEKSLPVGPPGGRARICVAAAHSHLLKSLESLPEATLPRLEPAFMESAVVAGQLLLDLNEPAEGLNATDFAIARAKFRQQREPNEPIWSRVYAKLLRFRRAALTPLERVAGMRGAENQSAALERRSR